MTDIIAYDKNGGMAYHYTTPTDLSREEIEQDLKDWCVDTTTHTVVVNGKRFV